MNYEPNDIQWRRGDIVIHDADAKEPKMLMKIVGFTRSGLAKTQYVDKRRQRKIWVNHMSVLHDPKRFKLNPEWGEHGQRAIEKYQDEWLRARLWNLHHKVGVKVVTTSADGGFETVTAGEAYLCMTGLAKVYLEVGGAWLLKFVQLVEGNAA